MCTQLVAKTFPPGSAISQVIKTAKSYWEENPERYIAIHCAYGVFHVPHLSLFCMHLQRQWLPSFGAAKQCRYALILTGPFRMPPYH
jgi:hypothetical protein